MLNIDKVFCINIKTSIERKKQFEENFAQKVNRKYAIAVANGTLAIDAAIDALESKDPILSKSSLRQIGEWFSNGVKLNHPLLSPKNASIEGWPPLHIICGTYDILYPDIKDFYTQQRAVGNNVYLYSFEKMIHGFTHISLPEAKRAMLIIKKLIG